MKPWEKYQSPGPWENYKQQEQQPEPVKQDIKAIRKDIAADFPLQIGPFDTGVTMPQWLTEALSAAGMRMNQIYTLGRHKPDKNVKELLGSPAGIVGQVVADIASIAGGGTALKAASALPKVGGSLGAAGQALTAPTSATRAAAAGSAYGAATTDDRVGGGIAGGVGGALGQAIPKAAGAIVKPQLQKGAELLRKQGVEMTPGELLGGWVQRIEDGATAIPFVGDFIKSAKGRSLESFNRSLINDALENVGSRLDDKIPVGREAIAKANDIISKKYDDLLPTANVQLDDVFLNDLNKLNTMVEKLPKKQQKLFTKHLSDEVLQQFDNPNLLLLGETFKTVDSSLRKKYKSLIKSSDTYQQELGAALREVHSSLIGMAKRQNPQWADDLARLDQSYAMMSRINEASSFAGAKNGIFTPSHIVNSVKKSAVSKRKYASGRAHGQELAETAKDILPSTVPDSGTATRAMIGAGVLGGAAMIDPLVMAGMMAGAGGYTRPGVNALAATIANRPAAALPVSNALRRIAPYSGALGVPVGISVPE